MSSALGMCSGCSACLRTGAAGFRKISDRQQSSEGLIAATPQTFSWWEKKEASADPVALTEQTAGQTCY